MVWLFDPQIWVALLTLTVLEVVLGIDNVVFIAILVDKLPLQQRRQARLLGLALAMLMRIALLFSLSWMCRVRGNAQFASAPVAGRAGAFAPAVRCGGAGASRLANPDNRARREPSMDVTGEASVDDIMTLMHRRGRADDGGESGGQVPHEPIQRPDGLGG